MNNYKISYAVNGAWRSRIYSAESEAEALEDWEFDHKDSESFIQFIDCKELEEQ